MGEKRQGGHAEMGVGGGLRGVEEGSRVGNGFAGPDVPRFVHGSTPPVHNPCPKPWSLAPFWRDPGREVKPFRYTSDEFCCFPFLEYFVNFHIFFFSSSLLFEVTFFFF